MTGNNLCGLTVEEIFNLIHKDGYSYEHSLKISNAIYKKGIRSFSTVIGIPKKLKVHLDKTYSTGVISPDSFEMSSDGTIKYLFTPAENRRIETVYIPETKRTTVCVSSQSGCRMGCKFCATGRYGFHGDLTAGEIVSQVTGIPASEKVTHVVFMGMGEPMDNLDNVMKAASILTAQWGKALSPANITISTVGITPGISRFLADSDCNLTVSIFSPFSDERKEAVPVEKKYPVEEIIRLMRNATISKKRRMTVSYVMMSGKNDSEAHLEALKRLLAGSPIRVNLLPYHPVATHDAVSSSDERMMYFKHGLVTSGISASIRKSRGSDIKAACGLLASGLTA